MSDSNIPLYISLPTNWNFKLHQPTNLTHWPTLFILFFATKVKKFHHWVKNYRTGRSKQQFKIILAKFCFHTQHDEIYSHTISQHCFLCFTTHLNFNSKFPTKSTQNLKTQLMVHKTSIPTFNFLQLHTCTKKLHHEFSPQPIGLLHFKEHNKSYLNPKQLKSHP